MLINAIDLLNQSNPGLNGQTPGDLAGLFASLLQTSLNGATPGERTALLEQLDTLGASADGASKIEQLLSGSGDQSIDLSALIQLLAAQTGQAASPTPPTVPGQAATQASNGPTNEAGGSLPSGAAGAEAQPTGQATAARAPSASPQGSQGLVGNGDPNGALTAPAVAGSGTPSEQDPPIASQAFRPESTTQSPPQSNRAAPAVPTGTGQQQPAAGSGAPTQVVAATDAAGRQPTAAPDLPSSDDVEVSVSVTQRQTASTPPLSNQVTAAILSSSDEAVTVTAGQAASQAGQAVAQAGTREGRARATTAGTPQDDAARGDSASRSSGTTQSAAASAAAAPNSAADALQTPKQPQATTEPATPAIGGEAASSQHGQAGLHSGSGISSADTTTATTQASQHKPHSLPAQPAEQIAMHINRSLSSGRDRVTVHLEPAELGKIEVKLDLAKDGTIRAMILADKPDTLDMLQRDSRVLERALHDAGVKTGADSLSYNLRGEGQAGQFARQQGHADPDGELEAPHMDEPSPTVEPSDARSVHQGSLDISV